MLTESTTEPSVCYHKGMDLTHYTIDESTPAALIPMIMAYALPHGPIPSKQQLLERRYELDGHLTMKLLAEDVGINIEGRSK